MRQTIQQSIIEYARIDFDIVLKDVEKATMYNDLIGYMTRCGKERSSSIIECVRVHSVGLLRHA